MRDHAGGGVRADDAGEVRGERVRDDAMAAAEVEGEGARAAVVGEEGAVEGVGVGWAVGGVGGVGEGGFAGL